jgi:hypothetical protein
MFKLKYVIITLLALFSGSVLAHAQGLGNFPPTGSSGSGVIYVVGTGTAQAQTIAPTTAITNATLVAGVQVCWMPAASNSGPGTTLAGSGTSTFSAKTITKGPSGILALIQNDIFLGAIACAAYDGTEFQLQNPQAGVGALTSTTNYGSAAQALNLYVSNGCTNGPPPSCTGNFEGFLAQPSLAASLQWLLPATDASTAGQPLVSDAAQHLSFAGPGQKVSGSCAPVGNSTAVTSSNPTINTDQNLIQLSIPAGCLNTLNQLFDIKAGGIYSSTAASTPVLTFKAKLCTISGCGSGTVVPLFNIVSTALNTAALTNATYNLIGNCVTSTIGATGNLICHGSPGLTLDTGATLSTPDNVFADTNTAVSSPNIDLTAALFLQFTVAQSVAGASNSYTQQLAAIR